MRDNARQTTAAFMGRAAEWEPRPFARSGGGERDKAGWEGRSSLCRLFSFLPWKTPARTPSGPLPARKNNHTPLTPRPRRPSKHIRRALSGRKKKKKKLQLSTFMCIFPPRWMKPFSSLRRNHNISRYQQTSRIYITPHTHTPACAFSNILKASFNLFIFFPFPKRIV